MAPRGPISRREWNAQRVQIVGAAQPPSPPAAPPSPVLPPSLELLRAYSDWRNSWSHVVAGDFARDAPYSGLLFYAQADGVGELYATDGAGGISLLQSHADWRTSWSLIVPIGVRQTGGAYGSGLLFYDPAAGLGAFYATDGEGGLILLAERSGWRDSWTHIVAGQLSGSQYSDLLFYDETSGAAELCSTDGAGGMTLLARHGWNPGWSEILVQRFRAQGGDKVEGRHDVLFYAGATGDTELYEVVGSGGISPIGSTTLPASLSALTPGTFGAPFTSVLTYDRAAGHGLVVDIVELDPSDSRYTPTSKVVYAGGESFDGWRTTWDAIVPGSFWVADEGDLEFDGGGFTDLLFYDRRSGHGELYLHEPPDFTSVRPLDGYCSAGSVRPGETLSFFVSSQVGPYTISIYRQAAEDVHVADVTGLPTAPTPLQINRGAWRDGAGWPAAGSLPIPTDWPSGVYLGRVQAAGQQLDIPFIVRAAADGTQAGLLAVMNDTTYEAYNHWGGRSLYGFGSHGWLVFTSPGSGEQNLPWAFHVSFRRPVDAVFDEDQQKWTFTETPLIRWLAQQEIAVEWCTLVDLHREPGLLQHYRLVVNVGHTEYVSKEMHDNVVDFVSQGGNAAFFAGNQCWWRVRIDDDGNGMTCFKKAAFDPVDDPGTQTVNWPDAEATQMTGVAWSGFVEGFLPDDDQGRADAQYVVEDASHWALAETGLANGDRFGVYDDGKQTVIGTETDVRRSSSPSGFTTLAEARLGDPVVATMGVFTRGGTVFTASTIDWTRGLSQDGGWTAIDQITRNVLDRLNPDWAQRDLTLVSGAPVAAGDPRGYAFEAQGTLHVVYRAVDGHIHELWRDANGWGSGDLCAVTGAPAAAGDPSGYVFAVQGTQHVVYRAVDGHVHELWWDANGWGSGDLCAVTGAPAAAGDPSGYAFESTSTQHVVYRAVDGHVHELWWDAAGGWGSGDLCAVTGAPSAAGDPSGYAFESTSTQHVVYRAVDGHVHELWWDAAGGWGSGDLCAVTGAPAAAGDPSGYAFESTSTQHVVYRAVDGHIHELWWDAAGGWGSGDLNAVTGAPPPAGDPCGYAFEAQPTQHVVYRDAAGHVHELWWDAAGGWAGGDLTAVSGAAPAIADPFGFVHEAQGTQHVVYRGSGGHVLELRWGLG